MPTSGDDVALLDTSTAVPFLLTTHAAHDTTFNALHQLELGLSGHAQFETFSTLTRMPEPGRTSPSRAVYLIEQNFPHTVHLTARRTRDMLSRLALLGIAGGAIYDALVAAAAEEHGLPLYTRDRRALLTYQRFGADYRLLD